MRLFELGLLAATLILFVPAAHAGGLNILLTNDDGYGSPGITAVQTALEAAGHTVYVVAPAGEQSGNGTSVNTDVNSLVDFTEHVAGREWSIDGTPTDAVNAAFGAALQGIEIDLVVSGANAGENVGIVTNSSGTVSAAMRALRLGHPSIAISVATDLKNLYSGIQLLSDDDPANDALGFQLVQLAEANQIGAMDDAAALVVDIIEQLQKAASHPWSGGRLLPEGIGLNVNSPARETADWSGVRFTKSDDASVFDLTFADVGVPGKLMVAADIDQTLLGVVFGQVPVEVLDLSSEGQALAGGYSTISPMDGRWSSDGAFLRGRSVKLLLHEVLR